jgi:hypothetical protein
VESHFSLAALVQNTDHIFGPIIVTYFATQANQLRGNPQKNLKREFEVTCAFKQIIEKVFVTLVIIRNIKY